MWPQGLIGKRIKEDKDHKPAYISPRRIDQQEKTDDQDRSRKITNCQQAHWDLSRRTSEENEINERAKGIGTERIEFNKFRLISLPGL